MKSETVAKPESWYGVSIVSIAVRTWGFGLLYRMGVSPWSLHLFISVHSSGYRSNADSRLTELAISVFVSPGACLCEDDTYALRGEDEVLRPFDREYPSTNVQVLAVSSHGLPKSRRSNRWDCDDWREDTSVACRYTRSKIVSPFLDTHPEPGRRSHISCTSVRQAGRGRENACLGSCVGPRFCPLGAATATSATVYRILSCQLALLEARKEIPRQIVSRPPRHLWDYPTGSPIAASRVAFCSAALR